MSNCCCHPGRARGTSFDGVIIPRQSRGLLVWCRSKRHRGRCAAPISEPPEGGINRGKARIAACHGAGSSSGFFVGSAPCRIFTFVRLSSICSACSHGGISMCSVACVRSLVDGAWGAPLELSNFCCLPGRAGGSPWLLDHVLTMAAVPIVGDPDRVARQLADLSRAGLRGIGVS
jgi:hypothetical protein